MKRLMIAPVLLVATFSTSVWAQAPAANDPHHPPEAAAPAQQTPQGRPGMGGMPMMNMMSGMMNNMEAMRSMEMMRSMQMMGPGMAGTATVDRIEGRIAFLRVELKITEAQTPVWTIFADALRVNAKTLGNMRSSMMSQSGAAQEQNSTIVERLDAQERWMQARLEGTRTIKSALAKLYESLSDDQKKAANELLAPHMGMGGEMMAQMPSQMPPRMQPGQMRPGKR